MTDLILPDSPQANNNGVSDDSSENESEASEKKVSRKGRGRPKKPEARSTKKEKVNGSAKSLRKRGRPKKGSEDESDGVSEVKSAKKKRGRARKEDSESEEELKTPKKSSARIAKKVPAKKSSQPVDPLELSDDDMLNGSDDDIEPAWTSHKKSSGKKLKKKKSGKSKNYEVESIVGHRDLKDDLIYRIRWVGYKPGDDTWEHFENLSCPALLESYNLKNKVKIPSRFYYAQKKKSVKSKKAKKSKKRRRSASDYGGGSGSGSDAIEFDDHESIVSSVKTDDEHKGSLNSDEEEDYEVQKILDERTKADGTREFFVRWKKFGPEHDTWEPEANLSCPELIAEFHKQKEEDGIGSDDAKAASSSESRSKRTSSARVKFSDD